MLLLAAIALLVAVVAMVLYLVGGYVAIHRVASGNRSIGNVVVAGLAALVDGYLLVALLIGDGQYEALVPPAIHAVAAWRGHRTADAAPTIGAPPPPPPPPPPLG